MDKESRLGVRDMGNREPPRSLRIWLAAAAADRKVAAELQRVLHNAGFDVRTSEQSIPLGTRWIDVIAEEVQNADVLLILLSRASAESQWVTTEISLALAAESVGASKVVIPIVIERNIVPPLFLMERQYLDLSDPEKHADGMKSLINRLRELENNPQSRKVRSTTEIQEIWRAKKSIIKAQETALKETVDEHELSVKVRNDLFSLVFSTVSIIAAISTFVVILAQIFGNDLDHMSEYILLIGSLFIGLSVAGILLLSSTQHLITKPGMIGWFRRLGDFIQRLQGIAWLFGVMLALSATGITVVSSSMFHEISAETRADIYLVLLIMMLSFSFGVLLYLGTVVQQNRRLRRGNHALRSDLKATQDDLNKLQAK